VGSAGGIGLIGLREQILGSAAAVFVTQLFDDDVDAVIISAQAVAFIVYLVFV